MVAIKEEQATNADECATCDGERTVDCSDCEGTGEGWPAGHGRCSTCHGSGCHPCPECCPGSYRERDEDDYCSIED